MSPLPSILSSRQEVLEKAQKFVSSTEDALIVILGPTASGKTTLSLELAHSLECEIVNADSRQLYRGLDIGTAKVSKQEQSQVPHHLIDLLDPSEESTVGSYQRLALRVISQISKRGTTPLLVGGSMLYLSSITDDLTLSPPKDPELRSRLLEEYHQDRGQTLYRRLKELDPETAASLHPHNLPHVVRSLEVCLLTGGKKSEQFSRRELREDASKNVFIMGTCMPMPDLYDRIEQRTDQMFQDGWIDEVSSLVSKGYTSTDPGMKSHGYREIMSYLEDPSSTSVEELKELITFKAREYARAQLKWWKGDSGIHWIDSRGQV